MGYNSVAVRSQICAIPRNSERIWT